MNEITQSRFPTMDKWNSVMSISAELVKSKALPSSIQNQAQLAMMLLAGNEAGMGVIESLNSYYFVNGKLTIYGAAVITQLKRAGYKVKWTDCTPKKATVTIISPDGEETTETYTIEEAVAAKLTGKDVWKSYPQEMLRHKALSRAVRFSAPEVIYSQYFREDIDGSDPTRDRATTVEAVAEAPKAKEVIEVEAEPFPSDPVSAFKAAAEEIKNS